MCKIVKSHSCPALLPSCKFQFDILTPRGIKQKPIHSCLGEVGGAGTLSYQTLIKDPRCIQ